jgi:YrbI family 3-deoxy-D-manno-octulosonate 8-phosphate phosphatase
MMAGLGTIRVVAMDVDGVLTDGGMYYTEEGEFLKRFNTRDGMGIELLRERGILPVIITKEKSRIVLARAAKMKVDEVHIGVIDKLRVLEEVSERHGVRLEEIAYIGDDINDLPVLEKVGWSVAVADAVDEVRAAVDYVTLRGGGQGAVREMIDMILRSQV